MNNQFKDSSKIEIEEDSHDNAHKEIRNDMEFKFKVPKKTNFNEMKPEEHENELNDIITIKVLPERKPKTHLKDPTTPHNSPASAFQPKKINPAGPKERLLL